MIGASFTYNYVIETLAFLALAEDTHTESHRILEYSRSNHLSSTNLSSKQEESKWLKE